MDLTKAQLEHISKRNAQFWQILEVIRASNGINQAGIFEATKIRKQVIRSLMREMREKGFIHIGYWDFTNHTLDWGPLSPYFVAGEGIDAKKIPQSPVEKEARTWKKAEKIDEAAQLRAIIERKHAEWKKTWKPHADIAAQWMMRG